jgi:predicted dehydrogenase
MNRPIGIGILGCGNVAKIHAEAILRVPALKLVSTCSDTRQSAESIAARYGVPALTNLDSFLSDPALQAVTICSPSGTHSELGCAAARAGKHVLVEKPIDVTLDKADALIQACERAGVRLGVAFQSRHLDAPRLLKSAVEGGRLGKPVLASAYVKWYRTAEYYKSAAWRGTLVMDGGGVLINQAIHTVDLLNWIAGPVKQVIAFSGRRVHPQIEGEDTLVAALLFSSGALGVIEAATSVYPGFKRRIEITGSEGTIVLDGDNLSVWSLRDGSPCPTSSTGDVSNGSADPMAIDCEGHRRVLADFAEAIRSGRKPVVDGHEGRKSLQLVRQIYDAANAAAESKD